jgi:HlyD family secretion protein
MIRVESQSNKLIPTVMVAMHPRISMVALLALLIALPVWADKASTDKKPDPSENPKKEQKLHTVKADLFEIEAKADGMFVPAQSATVTIDTKSWSDLIVKDIVEHGSDVKKGDVLISFDRDKIEEAIVAAEAQQLIDDLQLKVARQVAALDERALRIQKAAQETAKARAVRAVEVYKTFDRPLDTRKTKSDTRRKGESLEYQKEELKQLKKMYKADDLTEETEEIILTRQQNVVRMITEDLENTKIVEKKKLKIDLPQKLDDLEIALEKQELTFDTAVLKTPVNTLTKKLALEKLERETTKKRKALADLKSDRDRLEAVASAAGVVYYGAFEKADWTVASVQAALRPKGKVAPRVPVMTIVQPGSLRVQAWIKETDLRHLKKGTPAEVTAAALPDVPLSATLDVLPRILSKKGFVLAELSVDLPRAYQGFLVPGMTCEIKLMPYTKEDALTVPSSAIFMNDAGEPIVYLADGTKVKVTKGMRLDKKTEILKGVEPGTQILLERLD